MLLKIKVREPKNLQPVKAEVKIMAIGSNFHPIFDFQLLDHWQVPVSSHVPFRPFINNKVEKGQMVSSLGVSIMVLNWIPTWNFYFSYCMLCRSTLGMRERKRESPSIHHCNLRAESYQKLRERSRSFTPLAKCRESFWSKKHIESLQKW